MPDNYSDANATVRRENFAGEAGGAATTEYCKFRTFQQMKLKNVHAIVTTAGTVGGHGLNVFQGTTSVGAISLGTAAANTIASAVTVAGGLNATRLNLIVASGEQLSVKTLADATGKAHVIFEYHVQHDCVRTL